MLSEDYIRVLEMKKNSVADIRGSLNGVADQPWSETELMPGPKDSLNRYKKASRLKKKKTTREKLRDVDHDLKFTYRSNRNFQKQRTESLWERNLSK